MPGATFLETESLDLKTVEKEDLDFLQELKNMEEVRIYHPELYPMNKAQVRDWWQNTQEEGNIILLICKEGKRVGVASLSKPKNNNVSAGTGISVHPDHQGNGYATESMGKMIEFGFKQWNLKRIFSGVLEFNKPSQKVWEKLGFEEEAVHRDFTYCNNSFQDLIEYGLIREEWKNQQKKRGQN